MAGATVKEKMLEIRRVFDKRKVQAEEEYNAAVSVIHQECSARQAKEWGVFRSKVQQAKMHSRIALEQLAVPGKGKSKPDGK